VTDVEARRALDRLGHHPPLFWVLLAIALCGHVDEELVYEAFRRALKPVLQVYGLDVQSNFTLDLNQNRMPPLNFDAYRREAQRAGRPSWADPLMMP
jgi:hypothetical protein